MLNFKNPIGSFAVETPNWLIREHENFVIQFWRKELFSSKLDNKILMFANKPVRCFYSKATNGVLEIQHAINKEVNLFSCYSLVIYVYYDVNR